MLAKYQLEAFFSVLSIIKNRIDLGYNDLDTNKLIFHKMPNIFLAYIDAYKSISFVDDNIDKKHKIVKSS